MEGVLASPTFNPALIAIPHLLSALPRANIKVHAHNLGSSKSFVSSLISRSQTET